VEKWLGTDGKEYAALNLCYQSVDQLRQLQLLTLENPPAVYSLRLEGLTANDDGLYLLSDLKKRLQERIDEYDSLTTGITTTRQEVASPIKT
jgi:glucose-1-phosphatase